MKKTDILTAGVVDFYDKYIAEEVGVSIDDLPIYVIDHKRMMDNTSNILKQLGIDDNNTTPEAKDISVPHRVQLVHFANAEVEGNDGYTNLSYLIIEEGTDLIFYQMYENYMGNIMTKFHFRVTNGKYGIRLSHIKLFVKAINRDTWSEEPLDKPSSEELARIRDNSFQTVILFLATLDNRETREGKAKYSKKVYPDRKGKKAYVNTEVTYLSNVRYINSGEYGSRRDITWSNSWKVRGHWRYFTDAGKVGKDRMDNRGEVGRTWITPYEKQTQLEKVNKIKVLR